MVEYDRLLRKIENEIAYEMLCKCIENDKINYDGLVVIESFTKQLFSGKSLTDRQIKLLNNIENYYCRKLYTTQLYEKAYGNVYFMAMDKKPYGEMLVKIGFSKNVKQRLQTFKTSNPKIYLITSIPAPSEVEKMLHHELFRQRHSNEWFLFNVEKFNSIKQFAKYLENITRVQIEMCGEINIEENKRSEIKLLLGI